MVTFLSVMSCGIPLFQTYQAYQGALGLHLYSTSDLYHAYKKAEWVKKSLLLMTQCSNLGSASITRLSSDTGIHTRKFPHKISQKIMKYCHITIRPWHAVSVSEIPDPSKDLATTSIFHRILSSRVDFETMVQ